MIGFLLLLPAMFHLAAQMDILAVEPWRARRDVEAQLAAASMVAAHTELLEGLRLGETIRATRERSRNFPLDASEHCADATRVLSVFSTARRAPSEVVHGEARARASPRSRAGFLTADGREGGDLPMLLGGGCALEAPSFWIESSWR